MFICSSCGQPSPPGKAAVRRVVERREKEYLPREGAHRAPRDFVATRSEYRRDLTFDPGGHGWEIVREALVCSACARGEAGATLREAPAFLTRVPGAVA